MRQATAVPFDRAPPARAMSAEIGRSASIAQCITRALRSEPWWLRGVSWRLVGVIGVLTLAQGSGNEFALLREGGFDAVAVALLELTWDAVVALSILLIAAVLVNLERVRVPLPFALAVAVLAGTFVPFTLFAPLWTDTPNAPLPTHDWLQALVFMWRRAFVIWGIAAAAWYVLRRATAREHALRASEIARRQLETGMLEARLQALQAQVEPHFLFNTLAHVKRLYRTDPVRARRMLDSFRAYLQSALPQMRGGVTILGREVDLARAYLEVQQVRMGHRLRVAIGVPDELRTQPFPPMMLISLVENAIKHGLNPLPLGGTIRIDATLENGALDVAVIDTGRGIDEKIGSGVGLANVRSRLAALFGPRAALSLAPNDPCGVRATIRTPVANHTAAPIHRVDIREDAREIAA
jgi:signal transduction histidine kinase